MAPLTGKVAIVTGASSGIGLAVAKQLAVAGASVAITARSEDKLSEVKSDIEKDGGKAVTIQCDVTNRQEVKEMVKKTESELGPVDIVVNNAGVFYFTLMTNSYEDEWEQMIDVNCKGMVNVIGAVLNGMVERGRGHLVNMSSEAGKRPFVGCSVYNGTKHFVEGLSGSMRLELEGKGVKITCIQPGYTDTQLFSSVIDKEADRMYNDSHKKKMLEADDIAAAVIYAVTQPDHCAVNDIELQPK